MKKIALLLIIAAMCVPSYGTVLVYNCTMTASTTVSYSLDYGLDYSKAVVGSQILQAYVIFDVNLSTGAVVSDTTTAIVYGTMGTHKFQITLGGADVDQSSIVSISAPGESNSVGGFTVTNKKNVSATLMDIKIQDSNEYTGIILENKLYGLVTSNVICPKPLVKAQIPTVMNGQVSVSTVGGDLVGFGTSISKYVPALTQAAKGQTVNTMAAAIQASLTKLNYTAMRNFPE